MGVELSPVAQLVSGWSLSRELAHNISYSLPVEKAQAHGSLHGPAAARAALYAPSMGSGGMGTGSDSTRMQVSRGCGVAVEHGRHNVFYCDAAIPVITCR